MLVASEFLYWSAALGGLWVVVAAIFREGCQSKLSAPTPREQGNAMVSEAQDGYHIAVVGTVVVAYLSPLGEALVGALRRTPVSEGPPVLVGFLTSGVVLMAYALLALFGVVVVYLSVRGTYLRTTDKRPPLGDGTAALSVASILHFAPAYVVVLLTTAGRRPPVAGLVVAVFLTVAVPVIGALYGSLLVETREPTAEERALVASSLAEDVDLQVGLDDYDSHQIAVDRLLFEAPQVFLGGDVVADLGEECIETMLRVGYRQSGWTYVLLARTPVGAWMGLTTALLVQFQLGFLTSLAVLVGSYLAFEFTAGRLLQERLLAVPEGVSEAQLLAAFEEFAGTRRVPIETYIDPAVAGAEGIASVLDIDEDRAADAVAERAEG